MGPNFPLWEYQLFPTTLLHILGIYCPCWWTPLLLFYIQILKGTGEVEKPWIYGAMQKEKEKKFPPKPREKDREEKASLWEKLCQQYKS